MILGFIQPEKERTYVECRVSWTQPLRIHYHSLQNSQSNDAERGSDVILVYYALGVAIVQAYKPFPHIDL